MASADVIERGRVLNVMRKCLERILAAHIGFTIPHVATGIDKTHLSTYVPTYLRAMIRRLAARGVLSEGTSTYAVSEDAFTYIQGLLVKTRETDQELLKLGDTKADK